MVKAAVIIVIVTVGATGMLVGGLIGHFVTKGQYADQNSSNSGSRSGGSSELNPNQPQPEKDKENRKILFDSASSQEIRETLRYLSEEPHLAGSERNAHLGEWMVKKWKEYGFKTKTETYDVLLSYPGGEGNRNKARVLDSNDGVIVESQEVEKALVPEMNTTNVVPPFNGYAKAGTVKTQRAYYVNYCRVEDFDYLIANVAGVNISNSIVICRYGKIFRGNKIMLAQQHGAVGVILYNDPADSVYGVRALPNETFPNSWFLPPSGAERGGTSSQKGDPLTMGFPSKVYGQQDQKTIQNSLDSFKITTNKLTQSGLMLYLASRDYRVLCRGLPMVINAQQNGAVGVIIYNDPQDNVDLARFNATAEDTFPNSWFLPPTGAERGSVMDFSGDPLTDGFPSKDYAIRKSVEQVRDEGIIPNIPTQPMGYGDAKKFMDRLPGNEVALESWKGKMEGVTYKYGGELENGMKMELINHNTDERRNITNVFGYIEGAEEPDRYVLIGNHRDAWMFGATDASSGTSIMMETSRMFAELMKKGWRPRRTIIFCSWDGEEYGIIGSIEWLDDVRVLVGERAVAYLNCDSGVVYNQVLKIGASPLMYNLIYESAKLVALPNSTDKTLYEGWALADKGDATAKPHISDLGSGSDHTGFYHRHGIASMDMVYYYNKKEINISAYYPLYHTSYDTFKNVEDNVDPDFSFHKGLSQYFAEMLRSLGDSVTIPFVTSDYATRLEEVYVQLYLNTKDILQSATPSLVGSLDYLKEAIDKFKVAAQEFDERVKNVNTSSWTDVRRINDQLFLLERSFLFPLGILDRLYIKHVVFAPGATDSYASSAFPGIGDALFKIDEITGVQEKKKAWEKVEYELNKAVYTIESASKALSADLI